MRLMARMAMLFKLLMLLLLTACGQKGDLYLPDQSPEATPEAITSAAQTTDAEESSDPSETRKK